MPRIRLVIADEAKAHEAHIQSYERGLRLMLGADVPAPQIRKMAEHHAGATRTRGTVHAEAMDTECPLERPNCRNCGDPAHAVSCQASGHCRDCGTKHGVEPDAMLGAHGYAMETVR